MEPSITLSNPEEQCVTFYWDETPNFYLGYRFIEGQPTTSDQPVSGYDQQPTIAAADPPGLANPLPSAPASPAWREGWRIAYQEPDPLAPLQLAFQVDQAGLAHAHSFEQGRRLQRVITFQPFAEGVRMWLTLTASEDIPGSFCVQQCLRFTGSYNAVWRRSIAHLPFLSELDMQAMGNPNASLTFARVEHKWFNFPAEYSFLPSKAVAPQLERMPAEIVDHGLIVRETPSRQLAPPEYWERVAPQAVWEQVTCGMYWERTTYLSNRHPADCVHAWVDFGPLKAGQARTIQGVVYYLTGSKDDLLRLWQKDFTYKGSTLQVKNWVM